ncbi:NAD(P)H-hydrate epimerase [Saccharicrinis carchari]|uniref:Bifunctional NAD(P)H-hydrate repair enzyme n=1 Tax=Saccharicrinis carchari TaxID=1168039 RepID=A0A521ETA7_SACCC|nr:NAD(P)H-hydrate dehydratase [Saccharicrinis carchari]SMO87144.1 NAD(P)H-hydrate epimerase [Saccharicrinis carchari]
MKILAPQQIRDLDQYTIQHEPISSIDLMERAAQHVASELMEKFYNKRFCIFVGTGNNGGDGLAVARVLDDFAYTVKVILVKTSVKLSADASINLDRLLKTNPTCLSTVKKIGEVDFGQIKKDAIIVDALFGSGLSRPLEGLYKSVVDAINELPNKVVSIDIPSGLFAEYDKNSAQGNSIIRAHTTLSFQMPKLSFFMPESGCHVGQWHVLDIGLARNFIREQPCSHYVVSKKQIKKLRKKRPLHSHKGNYGHALLIAGSYGKMGASIIASKACLRSGVGLLTAHVPHWGYGIIQSAVPEAMTSIDRSDMFFTEFPDLNTFSAIGIGPGLNKKRNTVLAFETMLDNMNSQALVIDADGLNILSENKHLLGKVPENAILTPHPKEFERLVGVWNNDMDKLSRLKKFCQQYQVFTVLKGAYTVTCTPNGTCYFNTTGNPGMATAGSGDALTGIITGLLAQNYSPEEAAVVGVYLHGKAGDLALKKESTESMTALDIISCLGAAFKKIG